MSAPQGPHRAAVLGSPIAHSLSPQLHLAAYAALGLPGWRYDRFEVDEAALPGFVEKLDAAEWAGLSLTMPLKRAVIPLLDEVSETARSVEAVNTLVLAADGRRLGDNTDIPGMVAALRERGVAAPATAAVLGAGATASSAVAALARVCAPGAEVTAYVRSDARAAEMRGWGERLGLAVRTAPWAEAVRGLRAELVVATTPAGTTDALAREVPRAPGVLFDVLYDPWPTALAASWSAAGGAVVSGLDLLVHQAVLQVEAFTGRAPAPLAAMRAAGEAALSDA
ncbi:shikimate dehydrogenase [Mangrovactinospora gilvigrisea]|uniref:Shikimate dehydrogenase n=1 Tax=Mangrovactinospora gilvigrisea TaxID=1428644 RepID=A0A1J7CC80_9ACTN|nr:shikimate dehydrogenase [Mangrovactinospora gilvigrisea]OIV39116.1 shikimate dehydrogenase [Mangrovactinospora gilvigrisea]